MVLALLPALLRAGPAQWPAPPAQRALCHCQITIKHPTAAAARRRRQCTAGPSAQGGLGGQRGAACSPERGCKQVKQRGGPRRPLHGELKQLDDLQQPAAASYDGSIVWRQRRAGGLQPHGPQGARWPLQRAGAPIGCAAAARPCQQRIHGVWTAVAAPSARQAAAPAPSPPSQRPSPRLRAGARGG